MARCHTDQQLIRRLAIVTAEMQTRSMRDRCFPPIARRDAHTLVLGSLPGRKSLEMQQYYAHPQNSFWRIIVRLFGVDGMPPYEERMNILHRHGIALWDVLAAAERPGSLDSSIVHASAQANDFPAFFRTHPRIRRVFFNGRKAEDMYRRFVLPKLGADFPQIRYAGLPSTSPAHAGMTFARKLARWRVISDDEP
jgi:double-stranded uracil-DNA glycosylase